MTKTRNALLLALLVAGTASAGEGKDDPVPSLELLEFLGEWQTRQGEFVDPLLLQGDDPEDATVRPQEGNAK